MSPFFQHPSVWSIRSVSCVWMNETNEMNQIDRTDEIDQRNQPAPPNGSIANNAVQV